MEGVGGCGGRGGAIVEEVPSAVSIFCLMPRSKTWRFFLKLFISNYIHSIDETLDDDGDNNSMTITTSVAISGASWRGRRLGECLGETLGAFAAHGAMALACRAGGQSSSGDA